MLPWPLTIFIIVKDFKFLTSITFYFVEDGSLQCGFVNLFLLT